MIWHNAETNPPEPLVDVLLAVEGETEAAEGFRVTDEDVSDHYEYSTGHTVEKPVYAWAELPACPQIGSVNQPATRTASAAEGL